jgi:hypothetical protein
MFDTIRVWNEYQDTGDIDLRFIDDVPSNMKKKFRIWRMDIPRDKDHTRQRIRNTWTKVKFTMNTLPEITLEELCGNMSSEFAVFKDGEWRDLDFRGIGFSYDSSEDCIIERKADSTEEEIARYYMQGNIIVRTATGSII